MKRKIIPSVGFYLLAVSFVTLIVGYILSFATFNAFGYTLNRFVIIFPIFAMIITILNLVTSFLDERRPFWASILDLGYSSLTLLSFAHLLIPFLTPIGIYFTVNMGDMETYAIGVPKCITGCVFYLVSTILFVAASFFKNWKVKSASEEIIKSSKNKNIFHISSIGAVAVALIPSIIWASIGNKTASEIIIENATIQISETTRIEYVENEKIDLTGCTFFYKDTSMPANEIKNIEYDFSKSGIRVITLTHEEENVQYVAKLPVTVYHIRHLAIDSINVSKKETTWDFSKLEIVAELNASPKTFEKPEQFSEEYQTAILLKEGQYTTYVKATPVNGRYEIVVTAGNAQSSFTYYDEYTFNQDRVLKLVNQSGTKDKLTLFVETNTNDFVWPDGASTVVSTGKYVFEDAAGNKTIYEFKYQIDGWTSHFISNSVDARVNDTYDDGTAGYKCTINGTTFFASANAWHLPVLGREG